MIFLTNVWARLCARRIPIHPMSWMNSVYGHGALVFSGLVLAVAVPHLVSASQPVVNASQSASAGGPVSASGRYPLGAQSIEQVEKSVDEPRILRPSKRQKNIDQLQSHSSKLSMRFYDQQMRERRRNLGPQEYASIPNMIELLRSKEMGDAVRRGLELEE